MGAIEESADHIAANTITAFHDAVEVEIDALGVEDCEEAVLEALGFLVTWAQAEIRTVERKGLR